MIPVKDVYDIVRTLSLAQAGAYASAADFNEQSKIVENILFNFHLSRLESGRQAESLLPFIQKINPTFSGGEYTLPTDFRAISNASAKVVVNGVARRINAQRLKGHTVGATLSSPIRKGMAKCGRANYYLLNDKIYFDPPTGLTAVEVIYYRQPIWGVYGYTTNSVSFVENYDGTASTNYEWPEQERSRIVEIFLYLRGLQIKEPMLAEFVNQNKFNA